MTHPTFETVLYDEPRPGVARVTLNRPEKRNAQNMQMTYDLNSAFDHALRDPAIKIIVLAAVGPHFSSGHDLSGDGSKTWKDFPTIGTWANFDKPGAEGRHSREMEIYLEITERWRNMSKPLIAAVAGPAVAGAILGIAAAGLAASSDCGYGYGYGWGGWGLKPEC